MTEHYENFRQALFAAFSAQFENREVMAVLDDLREAIRESTYNALELRRDIGYQSALGQEWRFRLTSSHNDSASATLFRAHVALSGATHLDLGDQELKRCDTPQAVAEALMQFVQRPEVQVMLRYLRYA